MLGTRTSTWGLRCRRRPRQWASTLVRLGTTPDWWGCSQEQRGFRGTCNNRHRGSYQEIHQGAGDCPLLCRQSNWLRADPDACCQSLGNSIQAGAEGQTLSDLGPHLYLGLVLPLAAAELAAPVGEYLQWGGMPRIVSSKH